MKVLKFRFIGIVRILPFLDFFARRPLLSIALVFLLSLAGSWSISLLRGFPSPIYHDEFSYLLAADTFAHGRLTNPAPSAWQHFETFDELMQPTYMSKNPPAQGLFLALGKVIFGHPAFGIWISDGLMCAAICWMLYAWVLPRWAFVGGLLTVIQFGVFTYWSQSYWGGAVAALGGALVFGSMPRVLKYQKFFHVICLALGIFLLLNSRPLEGILFAVPIALLVLPRKAAWRNADWPCIFRRLALPLSICMSVVVIWSCYYNYRITGNAFISPSQAYENRYSSTPTFVWRPLRAPIQSDHVQLEKYDREWGRKNYLDKKTWELMIRTDKNEMSRVLRFFFGSPLAMTALFFAALLYFNKRRILSVVAMAMTFIAMFVSTSGYAEAQHYAPFTCLAVLLMADGLRVLSKLNLRSLRIGLLALVVLIVYQFVANCFHCTNIRPSDTLAQLVGEPPMRELFTRDQVINYLDHTPEKYLLIVQYPPSHNVHWDWVYNDADIEHSKIMWARDLGPSRNAELISRLKDRHLYYVEITDVNSTTPGQDFR